MALAVEQAVSAKQSARAATIIDFVPGELRAPFALRCAALAVDYMVLLAIPILWLVLSRSLSEFGTSATIGGTAWLIGFILFIANFLVFPALRGQTLGKAICGLRIVSIDGTDVTLRKVLARNTIGYFLTVLTFGIGFMIAAVNTTGRTLHDLLAGTIVVRGRRRPV